MHLDQIEQVLNIENEDQKFFVQNCYRFNMEPKDLFRKVYTKFNNKKYKIAGMTEKNEEYYILLSDNDAIYVTTVSNFQRPGIFKML